MVVTGLATEAVRLDRGMGAEPLHVSAPVGGILADLKVTIHVSVDAFLEKIDNLPHRRTVDVESGEVISPEEELTIGLSAHGFEEGQSFGLVLVDLLFVLAAAQDNSEHRADGLVELLHLHAHLSCFKGILRDELDSTVTVALVGELNNDSAVGDHVTIRIFEHRGSTAIDINVPLSLVLKIDHAFLELDALG